MNAGFEAKAEAFRIIEVQMNRKTSWESVPCKLQERRELSKTKMTSGRTPLCDVATAEQ